MGGVPYAWSLSQYKGALADSGKAAAAERDELEKSIVANIADETYPNGLTTHHVQAAHAGGTRLRHVLDDTRRRQLSAVDEDIILADREFGNRVDVIKRRHTIDHDERGPLGNEGGDGY